MGFENIESNRPFNKLKIDRTIESRSPLIAEAERLAERLDDPSGKWYYVSVLRRLPQGVIDRLVGLATQPSVRKPGAYFNRLAETEIAEVDRHQ